MSAINPSPGAVNIAGSAAGSAGRPADPDRQQAEAAEQKFRLDRNQAAQSSDDVAQTDGTTDRDADGRAPWTASRHPDADESEDGPRPRSRDPLDERGGRLDLDA